MQNAFPLRGVVVVDPAQEGSEGGAMDQAVQPPELAPDQVDCTLKTLLVRALQVQR